MQNSSIQTRDINLIGEQRSLIHTYQVNNPGTKSLTLNFEKINLPAGTIVEFSDPERKLVKAATFEGLDTYSAVFSSNAVNIKIMLPRHPEESENFSFFIKSVETPIEPYGVIGKDQREPYMCYRGTDIGKHSLSSVRLYDVRNGASGSSLGGANKFMTNWHVVREEKNLKNGEIWFNWVNQTCDPSSPTQEPVRLQTDKLLAIGANGARDYAIFTVKEFDFKNSHVKKLFGGLKIRETKPDVGEAIYVPQYGNEGPRPMYISSVKGDGQAIIKSSTDEWVEYNADTQGGSSGSPVISAKDHNIVGLHSSFLGKVNAGTSPELLFREHGELLGEENESIIGEGDVTAFNLESNPFDKPSIKLDLGRSGKIVPFDTVKIENFDKYSIATVESFNIVTDEISHIKLKLEAIHAGKYTRIDDEDLSGKVTINITPIHEKEAAPITLTRCWLALKVIEDGESAGNYLARITISVYDPFTPPFDPNDAKKLKIEPDRNGKGVVKTSLKVDGRQYGYIALYPGEGPQSLGTDARGYAKIRTMVRYSSGKTNVLTLRGIRGTYCQDRPMNATVNCNGGVSASWLKVEFHPEDNPGLDLTEPFTGIIPIQATLGGNDNTNILLQIVLS